MKVLCQSCRRVVPKYQALCFKNMDLCIECFKERFTIEEVDEDHGY